MTDAMPDQAFEPVFETLVAEEALVVKSVLDAAGMPYLTRGEDVYDAFRGVFRGTVFGRNGRRVVFLVPAERAAEARDLLEPQPPSEDD
jgi:hypothetical protein